MNTRQIISDIAQSDHVHERDIVLINNLLKKNSWNSLQENYAKTLVKKYTQGEIKKEKELPLRRAVLRGEKIYVFGKLEGKDREKFVNIPGREFHPDWSVPCNNYSIKVLRELNCQLSQNLIEWEKENNRKVEGAKSLSFPEGLNPYPYQWEDWKRIEELNGRVLLAHQPRMGKTIQTLMYIKNHPELRPVLIIVPASIKIQWKEEINKWIPGEKVAVINGMKSSIPKDGIVIMNYDLLFNYYSILEDYNFNIMVIDEVHKAKNPGAKRTKAIKYLSKGIPHIIGISGTPINNRPSEFYTILNIIAPDIFNNHQKFLDRYCNAQKDPSGKGASHTEELYNILSSTFMIRRMRSEVWQDIPEKQRIIIPVEIENRKEYEEAEKDLIKYLRETKGNRAAQNAIRSQALARFNVMKDIASKGKLKQAIEWVEDFIEAEKLVTFCINRSMVETLNEHFKNNSVKLYGGMSDKQKDFAVKQFRENKNIDLFIGNIAAASVGLPLHTADATLTLQLDWVPSNHEQAEDRVINKEKKNVPITAYYMIAKDTIEEEIASMIDKKARVLSRILDGEELENEALLTHLIKKYSEK